MRKNVYLVVFLLFIAQSLFSQVGQARLMRFPAIHGNTVVFSYAGDLYSVAREGGIARKLTNDKGYEMFPRFSPDGNTLAFTAQYDGNTEVYVMPARGGEPKRLTFTATLGRDDVADRMGPNNVVLTWTPDGKNIVYRSRRYSFNSFRGQLFTVPKEGGLSGEIPLHNGGWCSYSPDGSKLALNRVFREFRTWKYYTGGMTDDVWIFDFKSKQIENITDNPAQDIFPMWHQDKVYYLSDRDNTMNLFVYDTKTKEEKKLTNFTDYDIKFPSLGDDAIVFEKGGFIYIYSLKTNKAEKITVQIANDYAVTRSEMKDAGKFIDNASVSPAGKRVVFSARGEVFSVPADKGITRNLTHSSGTHDRNAVWSPDGKYIAYLSDKSGEFEIYIQKPDGSEKPVQITKNADTYKYGLEWSPDSKKILWSDKKFRLRYVDIESKQITEVAKSEMWEIRNFNWSPDSKWVVYVNPEYETMNTLKVYNLDTKKTHNITHGWYEVWSPSFSSDGKYLLFASARDFQPIYSATEWNHAYRDMSKVYLLPLKKDTPSPFAPENAEVEPDDEDEEENGKDENGSKGDVSVEIDFEGLGNRIEALPVEVSTYWSIQGIGNSIYYCQRDFGDKKVTLKMYDLKKKKETELGNISGYELSANHKKMFVKAGKKYAVIGLPKSKIQMKETVSLSNMKVWVNNGEEWNQIFEECWRQMRDFFAFPNMHGVDWKAVHDKYAILVPHVRHRNDLTYIIGEMIGELNIGHAYIGGGDRPEVEKIHTGLLGAKLSRHSSGYYKIEKILDGENWSKKLRSPLQEVGLEVEEGDYILAVNGNSTKEMDNIFASLVGKADQQVELTINDKPNEKDSKKIIVVPVKDESELYYYNWVQNNIKKVNEATDGKVGYIHIPDMVTTGLNEFVKYFYPQLMKEGLIIDGRGNGGGNVSPMIIERLRRQLVYTGLARNQTKGTPNPRQTHVGPKVLLINNYSASDGDLFPYQFKYYNIGKVIGMRSWGAVTGIRGSLPLIDGGTLHRPEFAKYSADGKKWIIEGQGVEPDIVIDNDPYKEYQGEDQQLQKAIEEVMKEIKHFKEEDKGIQPPPPFPDKSPKK